MFKYSEKTEINMQFKMLELFRTIKADKIVKQDAGNIASVKLANILSPDRTNLEESGLIKEIYVFDINLNTNKVPEKFIEALTKSVNFQTLIKLKYADKVKYIVSVKSFEEEKFKIIQVFQTDWVVEQKYDFPITTKLENLFKSMIEYITYLKFRQDEDFEAYVERTIQIKKKQTEIEKLSKLVSNEKQPNIKMRLNDELKFYKKELKELEE